MPNEQSSLQLLLPVTAPLPADEVTEKRDRWLEALSSIGELSQAAHGGQDALRRIAARLGLRRGSTMPGCSAGGTRKSIWESALEESGRAFVEECAKLAEIGNSSSSSAEAHLAPRVLGCAVQLAEALGQTGPLLRALERELSLVSERAEKLETLYTVVVKRVETLASDLPFLEKRAADAEAAKEQVKTELLQVKKSLKEAQHQNSTVERQKIELRGQLRKVQKDSELQSRQLRKAGRAGDDESPGTASIAVQTDAAVMHPESGDHRSGHLENESLDTRRSTPRVTPRGLHMAVDMTHAGGLQQSAMPFLSSSSSNQNYNGCSGSVVPHGPVPSPEIPRLNSGRRAYLLGTDQCSSQSGASPATSLPRGYSSRGASVLTPQLTPIAFKQEHPSTWASSMADLSGQALMPLSTGAGSTRPPSGANLLTSAALGCSTSTAGMEDYFPSRSDLTHYTGSASKPGDLLRFGSVCVSNLDQSCSMSTSICQAFQHLSALARDAHDRHPGIGLPCDPSGSLSEEIISTRPTDGLKQIAHTLGRWSEVDVAVVDRTLATSISSAAANLKTLADLCMTRPTKS